MFRKASPEAIDLISALLEYTPTQRLSAIDAMCHPFFDELRDPQCRFPDSRHANGASKEMPKLFDFNKHGMASLEALCQSLLISRWKRVIDRTGEECAPGASSRP